MGDLLVINIRHGKLIASTVAGRFCGPIVGGVSTGYTIHHLVGTRLQLPVWEQLDDFFLDWDLVINILERSAGTNSEGQNCSSV
jgi:hypothetical protein